jgi:hypothetical protein
MMSFEAVVASFDTRLWPAMHWVAFLESEYDCFFLLGFAFLSVLELS